MQQRPFRVGTALRKITPSPEMGPVYRAGYKMMEAEELTGTVDDICLRCLTIEAENSRLIFTQIEDFEMADYLAAMRVAHLAGNKVSRNPSV